MKLRGKFLPISFNPALLPILSIQIRKEDKEAACLGWDELKDMEIDIEIKKHRDKRSLDANAYCWLLLGKLSAKLKTPPEEIYREAIKDIGDNYYIYPICNDAVTRYCQIWESNGLGWQTDTFESKLDGYTNVMCYYGSSQYDTAQMSRLLNVIIDECKLQGIPTETPDQIAKRLSLWESHRAA